MSSIVQPLSVTEIFRQYGPYVVAFLRRLGIADKDVEDVAQEVFLVVHGRRATFEGRSSLKTWLCGICLRKASEYRRKAYRRRERPTATMPERAIAQDHDRCLQQNQQLQALERALSTLPDKQRHAFILYEVEEMPMAEVAQTLGCPLFTAYTRVRAARKTIEAVFRSSRLKESGL